MFFAFVVDADPHTVLQRAASCAAAVQPAFGGRFHGWRVGDAVVGRWSQSDETADFAPVVSPDGTRTLWFFGEAFAGPAELGAVDPIVCRTQDFRARLLDLLDRRGHSALAELDGDFAVVVWDGSARRLSVAVDRFGLQRVFCGSTPHGFAAASTASAILLAVDSPTEPHLDALRDAVSAGGFPIVPHTYLKNVTLVRPHGMVSGSDKGAFSESRTWSWAALRERAATPAEEFVERSDQLWRQAIARRTVGVRRIGQTLSGGLDSRLILDSGAELGADWLAVSYGVAGCDDCRFAQAAAAIAGVRWLFHPLYAGASEEWFERRLDWVVRTDGLVDVSNLLHVEVLDALHGCCDAVMHGFIGDYVCGPTFQTCASFDDAVGQTPYFGGPLAWSWDEFRERSQTATPTTGAALRFVHGEQKLVGQTNALFATIHHAAKLRRPFVDHEFFDHWQTAPLARRDGETYRRWLSAKHGRVFRDVPWQKTGLPIDAGRLRWQVERARRYAVRRAQRGLSQLGWRMESRRRNFTDDETAFRTPAVARFTERLLLAPDAVAANAWNRPELEALVRDWLERAAAPAQKIGALLSFEHYHRTLPARLREFRAASPLVESNGVLRLT